MENLYSNSLREALYYGYMRSTSHIGRDSLIRILDYPFWLDVISEQLVCRGSELCGDNLCTIRW